MCRTDVAISGVKGSCFYNSLSDDFSKSEVITLVVLGVLSLLEAASALYGYFFDPSWLAGAHVLAVATLATWVTIGVLVLTKYIHNCTSKTN